MPSCGFLLTVSGSCVGLWRLVLDGGQRGRVVDWSYFCRQHILLLVTVRRHIRGTRNLPATAGVVSAGLVSAILEVLERDSGVFFLGSLGAQQVSGDDMQE